MCGISGIIKKDKSFAAEEEIQRLTDIISHRGPDDEGHFVEKQVALGHRRLAILDLSKDGHQPMFYQDRYVIVYNGEVYNYLELKEELQAAGYVFKSKTDTEVILAAYDKWGEECVNRFNGMWAFAIYDQFKNVVFCSRDRFGVKPFYYYQSKQNFAFGSEIKVFTGLVDWEPVLNIPKAIDFLEQGIFDHTDETFFQGVKQLKGGHNLVYDLEANTFAIRMWYDLPNRVKPFSGNFNKAKKEFKELFDSSVQLRLRSDVKVGSCLSGGLDSTAIVCTVNQQLSCNGKEKIQETVSACYQNSKFDEQVYINEVVSKTNVKSHKVFPTFDTLFETLEKIVWHQDEPFSSTSIFAQWHVFKEAKSNDLIVMLDGQGADEILAGYGHFYDSYFTSLLRQGKVKTLVTELKAYKRLYKHSNRKLVQFFVKGFFPKSAVKKLQNIYFKKPLNVIQEKVRENHTQYFQGTSAQSIKEAALDQTLYSNLPMLLHYEDRNSMAHSIESRVPFLDYRLVEFSLGLPEKFIINKAVTKFIVREALADTIPAKIKGRYDKIGFITPETEWFKSNASFIRNKLTEALEALSGMVNGPVILAYYDKNAANGMEYGSLISRLLIFHIWMKKFHVKIG
jgi:asparagine synthase (glutamine-hydrolysing)